MTARNEAWPFVGYGKIAESLDRWGLDAAGHRRLDRLEWVVTEKVHGANFCLVTDGREVRCANRREWLRAGETFYGWEALRDRLRPAVLELHALTAATTIPGLRRAAVYGELFGGGYPHPDVPPVSGVQPVQTGVWYAPGIEFCAFDLAVETADGARRYLDADAMRDLCDRAGLLTAPPLATGRLTDALNFSLGFDSAVSARLGLPPLPGPNVAEGVVVRPARETALETPKGSVRLLLKRKIATFSEDQRYGRAEKWEAEAQGPPGGVGETLLWEARARLNANRLANAVSKVGVRDAHGRGPSRARLLFRLVADEVLGELQADCPDLWARATEEERALLRRDVADGCRALLRSSGQSL